GRRTRLLPGWGGCGPAVRRRRGGTDRTGPGRRRRWDGIGRVCGRCVRAGRLRRLGRLGVGAAGSGRALRLRRRLIPLAHASPPAHASAPGVLGDLRELPALREEPTRFAPVTPVTGAIT